MSTPQDPDELRRRLELELLDSLDEELELEVEDRDLLPAGEQESDAVRDERKRYFRELFRLQRELVKLQDWVAHHRRKVVILFEGRDAAGKGGAIKRITQRLNPRVCRVVALPAPNDREKTQWYFQRYVRTCRPPARSSCSTAAGTTAPGWNGSWASAPRTTWRSSSAPSRSSSACWCARGSLSAQVLWFSITDEEQEFRFKIARIHDPLKQWETLARWTCESRGPLGGLYQGQGRDAGQRTHIAGCAVVGGAGGGQEARTAQLHRAPAVHPALRRGPAVDGPSCPSASGIPSTHGTRAGLDVRARALLTPARTGRHRPVTARRARSARSAAAERPARARPPRTARRRSRVSARRPQSGVEPAPAVPRWPRLQSGQRSGQAQVEAPVVQHMRIAIGLHVRPLPRLQAGRQALLALRVGERRAEAVQVEHAGVRQAPQRMGGPSVPASAAARGSRPAPRPATAAAETARSGRPGPAPPQPVRHGRALGQ